MTLVKKLMDCIKKDDSYNHLKLMDESGDLEKLLPIVNQMKDVGECKYHVINCFDHSILALKAFEEIVNDNNFFESHIKLRVHEELNKVVDDNLLKRDLIKLGVFLHDMGKPLSKTIDDNGRVHFKSHEVIGANQILGIGSKLGLSEKNINRLYKYIRYHMTLLEFYKNNNMDKENLFNVFDNLKEESIDIFLIGYADIISTRKLIRPNEDIGVIKSYMTYGITNYLYRYGRT